MIATYDTLYSTEAKVKDVLKKVMESDDIKQLESDGYLYESHQVITHGMQFGVDLQKEGLWMLRVKLVRQDG